MLDDRTVMTARGLWYRSMALVKRASRLLMLVALGIGPMLAAEPSVVFAQATRTWVSGVGDDANPCSRTAPCKTFAGAISKTASGGEINVLDPGGFGAVTITKPITIDGGTGSGFASILASGTNGVNVNATGGADVVTLRNLSINGAPNGLIGVRILAAKSVIIDNVHAFGFRGGSFDIGRGISDARTTTGGTLTIANSSTTDNQQAGIVIASSNSTRINAQLENVLSTDNGFGLVVAFGSVATVTNSTFSNNKPGIGTGIAAQSSGTTIHIDRTVVSGNGTGVALSFGSPIVSLSETQITGNTGAGVSASGGTFQTFQNNEIVGNGSGNTLPGGTQVINRQ